MSHLEIGKELNIYKEKIRIHGGQMVTSMVVNGYASNSGSWCLSELLVAYGASLSLGVESLTI